MKYETTTERINREQSRPGEDCIHEEVDYTDRVRITNPDTVQTWIPGSEWCWSHGRWEAKEIR